MLQLVGSEAVYVAREAGLDPRDETLRVTMILLVLEVFAMPWAAEWVHPDCRVSCHSVFMTKIGIRHTIDMANLDIWNSLELLKERE